MKKKLQQFLVEMFKMGTVRGFQHFSMYLRGKEEMGLTVYHEPQVVKDFFLFCLHQPVSRLSVFCREKLYPGIWHWWKKLFKYYYYPSPCWFFALLEFINTCNQRKKASRSTALLTWPSSGQSTGPQLGQYWQQTLLLHHPWVEQLPCCHRSITGLLWVRIYLHIQSRIVEGLGLRQLEGGPASWIETETVRGGCHH